MLFKAGELEIFPECLEITPFRALDKRQGHMKAGHFDAIAIVDFDLFLTVGREEGFFLGIVCANADRDLLIRPNH